MISGLIIGIILGVLFQKAQFCFVSGIRNIFHDLRFLSALFVAIFVQAVGFFTLSYFGIIDIPNGDLPLLSTLLGGFLFGFGMIMAGFCAGGSWFRAGEGSLGAFIVLLVFSITMASAHKGSLKWFMSSFDEIYRYEIGNIHSYFEISPFILVFILGLLTIFLLKTSFKNFYKDKLFWISVLIGLLGIAAWYFSSQNGREYGFGVAIPSANIIEYLTSGQRRYLNWGSLFVMGIFLGSFLSAIVSKGFKLTLPEPKAMLVKIFGAFIMGIGAFLAGGCTITNTLVATAYFSVQAWLASFMIIVGALISSMFLKQHTCRI